MILLQNINKTFIAEQKVIHALQDINLQVDAGEIFGVIGHSGAGKSTLIRCINLLERPDSGQVLLDGVDLTTLTKDQLNQSRHQIGMIFQHFNLLSNLTVTENVAFPLTLKAQRKEQIQQRVAELLELVGLTEFASKYPAQLSGGQKQRVGIARALANYPKLLLCDEATSALDPETTHSILELIAEINRTLNLTVVLITHEMDVIRQICDRVAVIDQGRIVEMGKTTDVFLHPEQAITRRFVMNQEVEGELRTLQAQHQIDRKHMMKLTYLGKQTYEPHLFEVAKKCNVMISILQGTIGHIKEQPYGQLIIELGGTATDIQAACAQLKAQGLSCEDL